MSKNPYLVAALAISAAATSAEAASIAVNFSENDANQGWLSATSSIGPTGIQAQYFNTNNNPPGVAGLPTRTGSLSAGSLTGLLDDAGNTTTASVTWSSSNTWWNSDGTGTDNQRLAVGYLDDGGSGVTITVNNVPFANYRVYGLLASDQGNTYTTLDFVVNGSAVLGGSATAYGNMAESLANTGQEWSLLTTSQAGNYWRSGTQTASTLTITGPARSGDDRASITGFIIEEVPEPGSAALAAFSLVGMALRRRRA
jgi:hypothetical protein